MKALYATNYAHLGFFYFVHDAFVVSIAGSCCAFEERPHHHRCHHQGGCLMAPSTWECDTCFGDNLLVVANCDTCGSKRSVHAYILIPTWQETSLPLRV